MSRLLTTFNILETLVIRDALRAYLAKNDKVFDAIDRDEKLFIDPNPFYNTALNLRQEFDEVVEEETKWNDPDGEVE